MPAKPREEVWSQVLMVRDNRIVWMQDAFDDDGIRRALDTPTPERRVGLGSRFAPSLRARDMHETIAFYTAALGFRLAGVHPNMSEPVWCELRRGELSIMFSPLPEDEDEPALTGVIYLQPDDVMALHTELESHGVKAEWGPEVMEYGMRELTIRDPNGYLLGFWEPVER